MSSLSLSLFGTPTITLNNELIHIGRRNAIALLAYLATTQQHQNRASLGALFWPDYSDQEARGELRRALYTLNKALGKAWFETNCRQVGLVTHPNLTVDVVIFRTQLQRVREAYHDNLNEVQQIDALKMGVFARPLEKVH